MTDTFTPRTPSNVLVAQERKGATRVGPERGRERESGELEEKGKDERGFP